MTKFWLRSVEAVLLALFLLLALGAWRLSRGALPLDVLSPYIESALTANQAQVRLKIGHSALRWADLARRPVITVEDVRAIDPSGVIAAFPRMDVHFSLAALFRGALLPEEIDLDSPMLRITRHPDGSFAVGLLQGEPDAQAPDNEAVADALMNALTQPAGQSNRAGYLSRVTIGNSTLIVRDEASGQRWLVPNAALSLQRVGADLDIAATLPVIDQERPWKIGLKGHYAAGRQTLELAITLDNFRPAGIAALATQLHPLKAVDLGVSGVVRARFDLAAHAARMESLRFDLTGDNGTLHLPAPLDRAYAVKRLAAKGEITEALDHIVLQNLRFDFDDAAQGAALTVAGEGLALNSKPVIGLDLTLDNLSLDALKHYWPEGAKENARRWIAENLNGGELSESRFHIGLGGNALEDLNLTDLTGRSVLNGMAVTYMKAMPPVERTRGVLTISPREVAVALNGGTVPDGQTGGGVHVRNGTVRLTELGSDHERARVTLDLGGDFGEVMRLIDHQPLGYATAMGLDARTIAGAATVNLDIGFPLISDLKLEQLEIGVKGKIDGAQIPNAVFGQPLTDSHLAVVLDRKGMDCNGVVTLGGIPAAIVWRENFGGGAFRSRYDVTATIDNAHRPLVGLSAAVFAPPYVDGPVTAHVIYTARRDGTATIESEADLRDATLAIRQLGFTKPPEDPAQATISAVMRKDSLVALPAFRVVAGDRAEIAGTATFGTDNTLTGLTIAKAKVDATDIAGALTRDADGTFHIDVRGSAFDSTYFWKDLGHDDSRGSGAPKTPLEIRAAFDRMWLAKEGDFRDVQLSFRQGQAGIEKVDFSSKVDGRAPFTFTLDRKGDTRRFHAASAAGGAVVRAVGLFDDIVGGNLNIDGEIAADGTVKGRADITNLKLVQAPLVARLLSVAALTGIVDELRGKGISFKLLRAPFTYADATLKISNGEMYGGSLGLTAKGTYSFEQSRMDFEGTIIPAYAINNILSNVPLIGPLLTGTEKGGGVLAATYRYQGDPATAQPSVNPLAALAPGITRRIFDIFKSPPAQSAAAPDNRVKPPAGVKSAPEGGETVTD